MNEQKVIIVMDMLLSTKTKSYNGGGDGSGEQFDNGCLTMQYS